MGERKSSNGPKNFLSPSESLCILHQVHICMSHDCCRHWCGVKEEEACLSACPHITNLGGKSDQHFSQAALLHYIYYIFYIYSGLFYGHRSMPCQPEMEGEKSHFKSGCVAQGNKKNKLEKNRSTKTYRCCFYFAAALLSVCRTLVSFTKMEVFQRCMLAGVSFTRPLRMSLLLPVSIQSNHQMSEGLKRFFRSQCDGAKLTNEGIRVIYLPFYNRGLHKGI